MTFFDGFGFVNTDRITVMLDMMIQRGDIPPVVAVFIYNPSDTRSRDMSCYEPMHLFLTKELMPKIRTDFNCGLIPAETTIIGRSRSGLGAACAAIQNPDYFGNVISQSGAFWWGLDQNWEWLTQQLAVKESKKINFYIEVGSLEDSVNPSTGLSMLTVSRHFRDVALAKSYQVKYNEFPGGHDIASWRITIQEAIKYILKK